MNVIFERLMFKWARKKSCRVRNDCCGLLVNDLPVYKMSDFDFVNLRRIIIHEKGMTYFYYGMSKFRFLAHFRATYFGYFLLFLTTGFLY